MELSRVLRAQWDRLAAVIAVVVGLVALLIGYLGVSGTPHVAAQLPYIISGGLTAIFFLSIGVTLWLSADLRDDWRELRALRLALGEPEEVVGVVPESAPVEDAAEPRQSRADLAGSAAARGENGSADRPRRRRDPQRRRPVRAVPDAAVETGTSTSRARR